MRRAADQPLHEQLDHLRVEGEPGAVGLDVRGRLLHEIGQQLDGRACTRGADEQQQSQDREERYTPAQLNGAVGQWRVGLVLGPLQCGPSSI